MPSSDTLVIYLFVIGGACTVIGFMAVWILNSIKKDIDELKNALMVIPALDRRVTKLETQIGIWETKRVGL